MTFYASILYCYCIILVDLDKWILRQASATNVEQWYIQIASNRHVHEETSRQNQVIVVTLQTVGAIEIQEEVVRLLKVKHLTFYGTSRQRSVKGAVRKKFPLQKPRWE